MLLPNIPRDLRRVPAGTERSTGAQASFTDVMGPRWLREVGFRVTYLVSLGDRGPVEEPPRPGQTLKS